MVVFVRLSGVGKRGPVTRDAETVSLTGLQFTWTRPVLHAILLLIFLADQP